MGDGVAEGVRVADALGDCVALGLPAPEVGQAELAGYWAITITQATRFLSELAARAAPTHLKGSEVDDVSARTPLPP
ncbi:MAG: hypothetical protein C4321_07320 [Chloroflexota bacterium]